MCTARERGGAVSRYPEPDTVFVCMPFCTYLLRLQSYSLVYFLIHTRGSPSQSEVSQSLSLKRRGSLRLVRRKGSQHSLSVRGPRPRSGGSPHEAPAAWPSAAREDAARGGAARGHPHRRRPRTVGHRPQRGWSPSPWPFLGRIPLAVVVLCKHMPPRRRHEGSWL